MLCPCHSQKLYAECCRPFHNGVQHPETPLQLMRSRYSAYALSLIAYIIETSYPPRPLAKEIEPFCRHTEFVGLDILESGDDFVTFRAHLRQNGCDVSFTEKSAFCKENGKWHYKTALYLK